MIEIKGKFTIHYNGELIGECENAVVDGGHNLILSVEFGNEREREKEPEEPDRTDV